jgi:hypothetical protein
METKISQITELSNLLANEETLNVNLIRLFNRFGLGRLMKQLCIRKERGTSAGDLILLLCLFRIHGQGIFQWYRNSFYHLFTSGKNCFYRFLSRSDIDWRRMLYGVCRSFNRQIQKEKDSMERPKAPNCFIIDDTFLSKTGSCMEGVSRVFDHVSGKCKLGFKLLLLAFFDGTSTIGCDFTLHREKGKNRDCGLSPQIRKEQYSKRRANETPGYIRFK